MQVDRYCFRAPYVASLLRNGLGLPESGYQIEGGNVAWTLGAALAEGSKVMVRPLPQGPASLAMVITLWVLATVSTAAWVAAAAVSMSASPWGKGASSTLARIGSNSSLHRKERAMLRTVSMPALECYNQPKLPSLTGQVGRSRAGAVISATSTVAYESGNAP